MRLVVDELEVVECERVDIGLVGVDLQGLSGAQPPLSQQGWYFNHAQPTRGGRRGVQRAMAVAYREVQGRVLELLLERLHVVAVHVGVAEGVHELAALQAAHLRDHAGEQRVACDVERHAQAKVARALVHLAGQLTVRHVKLRRRPSGVSYSKNAKAAGGGGGGGVRRIRTTVPDYTTRSCGQNQAENKSRYLADDSRKSRLSGKNPDNTIIR